MLLGLRFQNIALLGSIELTFDEGFTVLTGETGAGKSILLDALDILFGGNQVSTPTRLLRDGESFGQIEATFLCSPPALSWLNHEGFVVEGNELIVSRELRLKENRLLNRCRLNGIVVNRQQISALRPLLIDLTVQGQTHKLGSSANQLQWLDQLGSAQTKDALIKVHQSWRAWEETFSMLKKVEFEKDKLIKKNNNLQILIEELEAAQLDDPFEDVKLQAEEDRLVNSVKLIETLDILMSRLQEGSDMYPSVADQIGVCIQDFQVIAKLDPSLTDYVNQIFDIHSNLQGLIIELQRYISSLDNNSSRLEEVQIRLFKLRKLLKIHGTSLPELLEYRDKLRSSFELSNTDELIADLKEKEEDLRKKRNENNLNLSKIRQVTAIAFEKSLMKHLRALGLLNVHFKIDFKEDEAKQNGADSVQFLFSANPGETLAPLHEIASGGEMSRFLLALKTVLSTTEGTTTLLFDEIDSGVSGRISGAIAKLLKELAMNRQVFCITHQPLIAAVADNHFRVYKSFENGVTHSYISQLSDFKDRQKELAELAGGDFEEARLYAACLLDHQAA